MAARGEAAAGSERQRGRGGASPGGAVAGADRDSGHGGDDRRDDARDDDLHDAVVRQRHAIRSPGLAGRPGGSPRRSRGSPRRSRGGPGAAGRSDRASRAGGARGVEAGRAGRGLAADTGPRDGARRLRAATDTRRRPRQHHLPNPLHERTPRFVILRTLRQPTRQRRQHLRRLPRRSAVLEPHQGRHQVPARQIVFPPTRLSSSRRKYRCDGWKRASASSAGAMRSATSGRGGPSGGHRRQATAGAERPAAEEILVRQPGVDQTE